jgi:hypothetical protein
VNRTTVSFLAGVAALALVTGWASTGGSGDAAPRSAQTAAELPVQRSGLLCPAPSTSDLADTTYTSFTPATEGADEKGTARLDPATGLKADDTDAGSGDGDGEKDDKSEDKDSKDKSKGKGKAEDDAFLSAGKPGTPVSENTTSSDAPALTGSANGGLAPGWTVQQTTEVTAGSGRGLQGLSCSPADTEFWFPGASTAADRTDYVHLTNPDDSAAVVDIELHGKEGALEASTGEDITVPPRSSEAILLSTLIGSQETNLTVHVVVRSGRVAAAVQALDDKIGGDWITASADPATSLVVPGIPKDATQVRLVAHAPGDADAELKVRLATPTGLISPADHETLLVKAGMTAAVDLGDITRGEAGSLVRGGEDERPGGRRGTRHARQERRRPGDRVHPGDLRRRAAGHRRRQQRQGHHAVRGRAGEERARQGHRLGGRRRRQGRGRHLHRQGRHHPGDRAAPAVRPQGPVRADRRDRVRRPGVRLPDPDGHRQRRPGVHRPDPAVRPGDGTGAGHRAGPVHPAEVRSGPCWVRGRWRKQSAGPWQPERPCWVRAVG